MSKNLTPAEDKLIQAAISSMFSLSYDCLTAGVSTPPDWPNDKKEAVAQLLYCAEAVMRERKIFVARDVLDELVNLLNTAAKATTRTPGAASHSHYAIIVSEDDYVRLVRMCNENGASDEPPH